MTSLQRSIFYKNNSQQMNKATQIPEVNFPNRYQKAFEFEIVSNKEFLVHNRPKDHDPFRPHRLQFYAIILIKSGEGHHFIDFKRYAYKAGSVIFVSKDQVHAFEWNFDRDASFLLFTEKFLERSSLGSNLMHHLTLYNYHLYSPVLQLPTASFEIFTTLVERIETEFSTTDDFATEEIIQSSLKIFLCMAERVRKSNIALKPVSLYHQEFLFFQKLLKEHLFTTKQVQFYADKMAISTKKLNRITHEIKHQPAKTYINELLITEIKRLLTNTALSIKEISYKTGFEEPTNFVKYFKKYAKMTPVAFRKQI